ncbi:MKRN2 opposite strand protein-like protein, partial [Leptotrombidium deliense]
MPEGDPGILCFQHCDKNSKVFCLELPDYCPQCDSAMTTVELMIPPFQIPFPFTCAKNVPNSVIIRPTDGDFLHHYQNAADLHIGLTDSRGDVYEFDKYGLHIRAKNWTWNQCLCIPIVSESSSMWKEYWDYTLAIVSQLNNWTSDKYSEDSNNCYSFVLTFLRMLQVKELKPSLTSKTQFCKDFI